MKCRKVLTRREAIHSVIDCARFLKQVRTENNYSDDVSLKVDMNTLDRKLNNLEEFNFITSGDYCFLHYAFLRYLTK